MTTMRIIACIKQTGYVYYPLAIEAVSGEIDPEKMVYMLNPYDEVALEAAVEIKENSDNSEVTVITAGPPRAEKALRYAFAMGADRMIRINCNETGPWATSLLLTEVVRDMKPDLIFCGKKSIDTNGGQVGTFLAEFLDISHVSGVVSLDIMQQGKNAIVERYLGRGDREVIECDLPALFSVDMNMADPRYPKLPNRLRSEKEDIEVIEASSLGITVGEELDLSQYVSLSPPRPKPKKVFTPNSKLPPSERIRLIMSGGVADKKGDLIEGAAEHVADKIVEVLIREKIV